MGPSGPDPTNSGMIAVAQFERITRSLPFLRQAGAQARRDFMAAAYLARIPAGRDVFVEGDTAESIALLLSGVVRVYKIGENGREITLYRFGNGESCILAANVILGRRTFPAIATVEQDAAICGATLPSACSRNGWPATSPYSPGVHASLRINVAVAHSTQGRQDAICPASWR